MSDAEAAVDDLFAAIRGCRLCVECPRGRRLPHSPRPVIRGRASARIAVCGQAPGTRVHGSGLPFDDRSGVRLRAWMGVDSDTFYDERRIAVVPMGFCYPGQTSDGADLPPRPECAPHWRDAVFAVLPEIRLLLLIGRYAQLWHLGADAGPSLAAAVRSTTGGLRRPDGVVAYALPHPSWRNTGWLQRHPWFEAEVLPQLREDLALALRCAPSTDPFGAL